jgi:putative transposase
MRKSPLANNEFYHIYNRGTDKRDIFLCDEDYFRFLKSMKVFNNTESCGGLYEKFLREKRESRHSMSTKSLIEIIAYCLNPNHFHFILKQVYEKGIEKFMQKLGNGYTKYFNSKCDRSGVLFQGAFKSVHIKTSAHLLYLSAYVNKNYNIHGYGKEEWKFSSLLDYLGKRDGKLCNKKIILDQFNNSSDKYADFVEENALYMKGKKELKK